MAFYVRDEATDAAVRELARIKGKGLTETIREAVEKEIERARKEVPLMERIKALQEEVAKYPKTGLKADKAFFDELSGDL
jgi:antitoxin VapB